MLRIVPVTSSSVDLVAYEDEDNVLYLRFHGSKELYAYDDVPVWTVKELLAAESIGRYVNETVKPNYSVRRIQKLPYSKKAS